MTTLRIARLLPEMLNLNGSLGNAEILATRAAWWGANVEIVDLERAKKLPAPPDIVVCGHGTSSALPAVAKTVHSWSETLRGWFDQGVMWCGFGLGGDVLGQSVRTQDGQTDFPGLGLTAVETVLGGSRFSGEVCGHDLQGRQVAGYLNDHTTRRGEEPTPLVRFPTGQLRSWSGAHTPDSDGVFAAGVWVTALSGPFYALNPHLADDVLSNWWQNRHQASLPESTPSHQAADHYAGLARAAIAGRLGVSS